ncbi:hypothetical protein [Cupriavidus gilardii]|nr:hypothetical protein [Cupriavidus gilardii]UXC34817.1 hypothetical protein N4G38_10225 [Cupriavidus gilardii]UXC37152.1 hypothetical protein N4G38_06820 [Cupriavidus gilardii]
MNRFERFAEAHPRLAPWVVIFILLLAHGVAGWGDQLLYVGVA